MIDAHQGRRAAPCPGTHAGFGNGRRRARARRLVHAGNSTQCTIEAADQGQYRACLRPMTPDGPPILGLGRHRNLFLNCGHGHMGWTMACGTARIVADLMTGRMPELDLEGLTVRR